MVRWQSVDATDCKPVLGRLNSYPDLQNNNKENNMAVVVIIVIFVLLYIVLRKY